LGQEEVKDFLSSQIQQEMELWRQHGRCQFDPKADLWKDLLDTISELLCHHLQQVTRLLPKLACSASSAHCTAVVTAPYALYMLLLCFNTIH